MAAWITINQAQAKEMLAEITGALAENLDMGQLQDVIYHNTTGANNNNLPDDQLRTITRGMTLASVSALGIFGFVYPYERYKKIAMHYNLDASAAFGLDQFDDKAHFLATYGSSVISTWNRPRPADPRAQGWFARCVRNSFAHGQSTVINHAGQLGVTLSNAPTDEPLNVNFDVVMTLQDFDKLLANALRTFITNVVEGGTYQPLSTLIDKFL